MKSFHCEEGSPVCEIMTIIHAPTQSARPRLRKKNSSHRRYDKFWMNPEMSVSGDPPPNELEEGREEKEEKQEIETDNLEVPNETEVCESIESNPNEDSLEVDTTVPEQSTSEIDNEGQKVTAEETISPPQTDSQNLPPHAYTPQQQAQFPPAHYPPMAGFMNPFVAPYMPQCPPMQQGLPVEEGQQPATVPQGGYYVSSSQYQEMMQTYLHTLLMQAMVQQGAASGSNMAARGLSPASENGQVLFDDTDECADALKKTKLAEGTRQRPAANWLPNVLPMMSPQIPLVPPNQWIQQQQFSASQEISASNSAENVSTASVEHAVQHEESNNEASPEKESSDVKNEDSQSSQPQSDSDENNSSKNTRKEKASELINKNMQEIDKEINRRSQNANIKKMDNSDVEALLAHAAEVQQHSAAEAIFQQYQQAVFDQFGQAAVPWSENTQPQLPNQFQPIRDARTLQEIQQQNAGVGPAMYPTQNTAIHYPQANMHPSAHAAMTAVRQPQPMFNVHVPQQGPYPTYIPTESVPQPTAQQFPPIPPHLQQQYQLAAHQYNPVQTAPVPHAGVPAGGLPAGGLLPDGLPPGSQMPGLPAGQLPPAQAAEMLRQIQSGRIPEAFLQQQQDAKIMQKSPERDESEEWPVTSSQDENRQVDKTEQQGKSQEHTQPVWQYRQSYLDQQKRLELQNQPEEEQKANGHATQNSEKQGDSDTDTETDRLLGQNRLLGRRRPQYEKAPTEDLDEKPVHKPTKKRNKEVFVHEPAVLIEGVLFRARYLGSTQIVSEGRPNKATRMMQANEAVTRIKAPEGEPQPSTEVDLFISTEKIMVLNTDLQDIMMDHPLRTISYIADIGDVVVLMARRVSQGSSPDSPEEPAIKKTPKIICHVFESEEAQFIAQSIAQAFQVAYLEFLRANGIDDPGYLRESDYQDVLNSQEIFGDELEMFANKEKQKDVVIPKAKDEILGLVIVESGWGSMLPAVMVANLKPGGCAARCNQLNIGDQIIAVNGISLVGLPLVTCQTHIKNVRPLTAVKLTVVPTPPVVEVKIRRPDSKYQLGFSVQNGVIHMKTMPTSMFRLLTGQETPIYI